MRELFLKLYNKAKHLLRREQDDQFAYLDSTNEFEFATIDVFDINTLISTGNCVSSDDVYDSLLEDVSVDEFLQQKYSHLAPCVVRLFYRKCPAVFDFYNNTVTRDDYSDDKWQETYVITSDGLITV